MATRQTYPSKTPATPHFSPGRLQAAYSRLSNSNGADALPVHSFIPPPATNRTWRPRHKAKISSLSGIDLDGIQGKGTSVLCTFKDFVHSNAGLLLIMLAQLFFAFMNVSVKLLNQLDPPVPALELIAVRMIITYTCCMIYMYAKKVPHPHLGPPGVRLLLLARGMVGFWGLFGVYYSLQYLSLSDATVLTFLAPSCTAIAGAVLLGEQLHRGELVAGFLSLGGVVLIARPAMLFGGNGKLEEGVSPEQRMVAVGIALVGVLGATGAYITIRAIGKRAHALHSMAFFSSQCVFVSISAMAAFKIKPVMPTEPLFILLLLLIGLSGFTAQALLTLGLQRETAGRGSAGLYVQIVFAAIFERFVLGVQPVGLSVLGAGIIIACGTYVAVTKSKGEELSQSAQDPQQGAEEMLLTNRRSSEDLADDVDEDDVDLCEPEHGLEGVTKLSAPPKV